MGTGSYLTGTGGTASANAGNSSSSSFLTSPESAILSTAANIGSQFLKSDSVNFRGKYARNQLKHQKKIWQSQRDQMGPDMRSRVNAVKSAGLHPLAALGITPSATGPASQPMVPGQSPNYGSAISEGLQTAQNLALGNQQQGQSRTMAGLQLQEQQLRNDWLETQIQQSKLKMATQIANSQQDGPITRGPGPTQPGVLVLGEHNKTPTGITTSSQDAEDRWWEFGGAAQGILNTGYDIAGAILPADFGTGRIWRNDNRPNDPTTGKIVARKYQTKPALGGRPQWTPKRKPRRHVGRYRQY